MIMRRGYIVKPIRIFIRCLRDSLKSFVRNFSLSLASILCVTITLILVSFTCIASANINKTIENFENELNIVVYLASDVTEERILELEEEFSDLDYVESVVSITKDEWKAEMIAEDEVFENILNYLDENPLVDSFTIKVTDVTKLDGVADYISQTNDVDTVKHGEGMIDVVLSVFNIIETGTIIVVIALVLVTMFLIGNTIKLTIFSRRNEIEIMRLVGSSNMTIRLPFIFEGLLVGIIGAIIPISVSVYGYIVLYDYFGGILFTNLLPLIDPFYFIFYISAVLLIIGAFVGVSGSIRAVRKYLKV